MSAARAVVTQASRLSTRLQRIVLHCPELQRLRVPNAGDAAVGVYFQSGTEGRTYSIRHHDPVGNHITVDVVLHGGGVGTAWALDAAPGDTVDLSHARSWYRPEPACNRRLLATDLTGLPATARILSEIDSDTNVLVVAEVVDDGDLAYLPDRSNVTVTASVGTGNGRSPSMLAGLVAELVPRADDGYYWFAGEATQSRAVRKHLRGLGMRSTQFDVMGYWRAESEVWDRRYALVAPRLMAVYERARAAGKSDKLALEEFDDALEQVGL